MNCTSQFNHDGEKMPLTEEMGMGENIECIVKTTMLFLEKSQISVVKIRKITTTKSGLKNCNRKKKRANVLGQNQSIKYTTNHSKN